MESTNLKQWEGVNEFLKKCIDQFGSMNKNDYEVSLFHLMLINIFKNKTDNFISRELRIPESKIKRLRYESSLVYQKNHDELENDFYELIDKCNFKSKDGERIQFVINDKFLRCYINDILWNAGRFADSSFNSDIVSLTASDLEYLLSQFDKTASLLNKIKDEAKKDGLDFQKTFMECIKDCAIKFIKESVPSNIAEPAKSFFNYFSDKIKKNKQLK